MKAVEKALQDGLFGQMLQQFAVLFEQMDMLVERFHSGGRNQEKAAVIATVFALTLSARTCFHILILTYTSLNSLHLSNRGASNERSVHRRCFFVESSHFIYNLCIESSGTLSGSLLPKCGYQMISAETDAVFCFNREFSVVFSDIPSNDQHVNCHPFFSEQLGLGLPHKPSPLNRQGVSDTSIIKFKLLPKTCILFSQQESEQPIARVGLKKTIY